VAEIWGGAGESFPRSFVLERSILAVPHFPEPRDPMMPGWGIEPFDGHAASPHDVDEPEAVGQDHADVRREGRNDPQGHQAKRLRRGELDKADRGGPRDFEVAEKMIYFRPLCFTEYVIITPLGNPSGIKTVQDMARPGVPVLLPLDASPPGSAMMGILKQAGIDKAVLANNLRRETCVIKMMPQIIDGTGKASIVERRLTRIPKFEGKVEVIPIPENLFPPGPLTFTVGVMKYAKDRALADDYVNYLCSDEAQAIFERQGFIPSYSDKGRMLVEKLGVKDA